MPFTKRPGFDNTFELQAPSPAVEYAENEVFRSFGDKVSVYEKGKTLRKFGRNPSVGTSFSTVWIQGGDETYPTGNTIDTISSSDAGDTQTVIIEGHTISLGVLSFVVQTATLNGQNKVVLSTPLARCTRLYNTSTSDFNGDIYAYEDDTLSSGVPQTSSKIHLKVTSGNQSEKASTSISNSDYYIINSFTGYCFDKASAVIEFIGEFRSVSETPGAWRRVFTCASQNGIDKFEVFNPPFIIPKNSDVRVRARADGANTDVGAAFNGYLAKVIE